MNKNAIATLLKDSILCRARKTSKQMSTVEKQNQSARIAKYIMWFAIGKVVTLLALVVYILIKLIK